MPALRCPRCRATLGTAVRPTTKIDRCSICHGVAVTLAMLRRYGPEGRVDALWKKMGEGRPAGQCPSCDRAMVAAPVAAWTCWLITETCRACEIIWFDEKDLTTFTPIGRTLAAPVPKLSPRAAEVLAGLTPKELAAPTLEETRALCDLLEAILPPP